MNTTIFDCLVEQGKRSVEEAGKIEAMCIRLKTCHYVQLGLCRMAKQGVVNKELAHYSGLASAPEILINKSLFWSRLNTAPLSWSEFLTFLRLEQDK